ncbi:Succinate dehydrogenase [ubiquinone] cytochrome b small subunit, mitochondrial [Tolypocladium ophioglossoides CBS 100239]|uniref:Succinate dehydrogenase [ubiquinone] cytochrome b small subunit n=1 Tax=Tolypocladium ophioglossoides (strain CBS 100239) TaxID=1163406 RepID=A0A0L0NAH6_TOLOC|nr:Succinate dehydrogenase [ubiquinone] cytochrome b small subunit, mitochondrial [Tolypocladium ophioglossoides CBS 100239]
MASIVRPSLLRQTALASRCAARNAFAKQPALPVAALHSSSRRSAILPPGPRETYPALRPSSSRAVNDPAPVPEPNAAHGSYHWTFERLLAAGLVPLTIAPFASGSLNPTMDAIFCSAVLLHSHMGFQQCIIDYVPKKQYPGLRKFTWWALNLATLTVGVGLYEFETNDVGVTEAIKRVWKA